MHHEPPNNTDRISDSVEKPEHIRDVMRLLPADTLAHMRRVSRFVRVLSAKLQESGIYSPELEQLGQLGQGDSRLFGPAAFYHDIGKIGVPVYLLTKVGLLTEEELEALREHPLIGEYLFSLMRNGRMQGMAPHLIDFAELAALSHHEHWDGQGYPHGIRGFGIPLIARITAVCDAYDAMTTNRQYEVTRTHEEACRELFHCAGTQFDPQLVQLFLQNQELFARIKTAR